jgi:hypothetical protein
MTFALRFRGNFCVLLHAEVIRPMQRNARAVGFFVVEYAVDLLVEATVMVEQKAIKAPGGAHAVQCINLLKAIGPQLHLSLDFGNSSLEIQCLVHGLLSWLYLCVSTCVWG